MSVIQLEHLFFSYGDNLALKDVSFRIEKGDFVGIIGPNGGGKTTLLKIVMGFLKPSSGKIKVMGKNPSKSIRQMAYVPQAMRFDKQFPISVFELILLGRLSHLPWYGKYSKTDKNAAESALEDVGLSAFRNAPFGSLSGGQAQRALIARALVSKPQLLLLDEPTANVDSQAEADIWKILEQLHGKITILMVTHNLRVAIDQVQSILCVQSEVFPLKPKEVCEHFAMGLYHPPLRK